MPTFIRLHLEGLQQSWGEYTSNTERPTQRYPTRSGIGGLLCASLGLLRGDARIPEVHSGIRVHSRILREGLTAQDYANHTNFTEEDPHQKARAKKSWRDRRLEIFEIESAKAEAGKQIWRDFLEDWAFEVLVEISPKFPLPLQELEGALREPKFPQFLGRKSCSPLYPVYSETLSLGSPMEGFRLPREGEFPGSSKERYSDGGTIHIDAPNLANLNIPESWAILPVGVRDVVRSPQGRIFHERRGWLLQPPQEKSCS